MKVNKKINVADAVKFVYNEACREEIQALIPKAEIVFGKARHPDAVGEILIFFFKGFSNQRQRMDGKEGDWVILDASGDFEIITEKEFLKQYEFVV